MNSRFFGRLLLDGYVWLLVILVTAPVAVVFLVSLTSAAFISMPPRDFSFRWYLDVLSQREWLTSVRISLIIGVFVTLLSTICGVAGAQALRQMRGSTAAALQTFLLSPLMLPTMLIGFSLLQFCQQLGLPNSIWTIVLGHSIIAIPYVVRLVLSSFAGADLNVERAATILGASPFQVFWRVTLPMIRHGVIAGALFCMIVSLDDVNIALFLSDVHTTPLPVQLFSYIEQNADPLGAAVASILVIIAGFGLFICDRIVGIDWLFGLRSGRQS